MKRRSDSSVKLLSLDPANCALFPLPAHVRRKTHFLFENIDDFFFFCFFTIHGLLLFTSTTSIQFHLFFFIPLFHFLFYSLHSTPLFLLYFSSTSSPPPILLPLNFISFTFHFPSFQLLNIQCCSGWTIKPFFYFLLYFLPLFVLSSFLPFFHHPYFHSTVGSLLHSILLVLFLLVFLLSPPLPH